MYYVESFENVNACDLTANFQIDEMEEELCEAFARSREKWAINTCAHTLYSENPTIENRSVQEYM